MNDKFTFAMYDGKPERDFKTGAAFHEGTQCFVERLEIDFAKGYVTIFTPPQNTVDFNGTAAWVTHICPFAKEILVWRGPRPDAHYRFVDGGWKAHDLRQYLTETEKYVDKAMEESNAFVDKLFPWAKEFGRGRIKITHSGKRPGEPA